MHKADPSLFSMNIIKERITKVFPVIFDRFTMTNIIICAEALHSFSRSLSEIPDA